MFHLPCFAGELGSASWQNNEQTIKPPPKSVLKPVRQTTTYPVSQTVGQQATQTGI